MVKFEFYSPNKNSYNLSLNIIYSFHFSPRLYKSFKKVNVARIYCLTIATYGSDADLTSLFFAQFLSIFYLLFRGTKIKREKQLDTTLFSNLFNFIFIIFNLKNSKKNSTKQIMKSKINCEFFVQLCIARLKFKINKKWEKVK
jgi:hypothetical protein